MGWVEVGYLPPNLMSDDDFLLTGGAVLHPKHGDGVEGCSQGVCVGTYLQTNREEDWQKGKYINFISTEDIAQLKLDAFQGEGKARDRWNDVQYGVL